MIWNYLKLIHRAWRYRLADNAEINYLLTNMKPNQIAFDIGAHKGAYTFWMHQAVGKKGKVIAFEPQLNGYAFLKKLQESIPLKNVCIEHLAVSDKSGKQDIFIFNQNNKISYEASLNKKYETNYSVEIVATISIDAYCSLNNIQPDFLKIDVEGHEFEVLTGAIETLKKSHPKILLECEQKHIGKEKVQDCFQLLLQSGYKGYFVFDQKIQPLASFNFEQHQPEKVISKRKYCSNFIFE